MTSIRSSTIAIVGAGPAGIYTADNVTKQFRKRGLPVSVDLFERLPVPFGLVRYGVAPDHPRIQAIMKSLHKVLDRGDIRLVAGIEVGTDVTIEALRDAYDAVILTTGADRDAPLDVPGVDLRGSFGAAQFVSWYDAHPDAPDQWSLDAEEVAVIGAGNVALDITRMLARQHDDFLATDVPDHVYDVLRESRVRDIHVFARRGPAEAQFGVMELRELDEVADVEIVIDPEDMVFAQASYERMEESKQVKLMVETLREYAARDTSASSSARRVHLHFMQTPVRFEGDRRVEGLTVERTRHIEGGRVEGTGELLHYPVGQIYRAVGYASSPVPGVPFDPMRRVVPNDRGRVLDEEGVAIDGLYVSGWVKRGPVGLIGSTRSDSLETVTCLVEDVADAGERTGAEDPLGELLATGVVQHIGWDGWLRIDEHERALGSDRGRERIKVYSRDALTALATGAFVA